MDDEVKQTEHYTTVKDGSGSIMVRISIGFLKESDLNCVTLSSRRSAADPALKVQKEVRILERPNQSLNSNLKDMPWHDLGEAPSCWKALQKTWPNVFYSNGKDSFCK